MFLIIIGNVLYDYNELLLWYVNRRKARIVLFPAGTIVIDPYHRESVAHHEQYLNQHRTWVQALLSEVEQ